MKLPDKEFPFPFKRSEVNGRELFGIIMKIVVKMYDVGLIGKFNGRVSLSRKDHIVAEILCTVMPQVD